MTVVSRDRPGLIADIAEVLVGVGADVQSSAMSLLEGHFAWTLVVDADATPGQLQELLLPVCPHGVTISELGPEVSEAPPAADRLLVSVHGADRIGIVAAVARALADADGNIVELTTHRGSGTYVAIADVEFPRPMDLDQMAAELKAAGRKVGVVVTVQRDLADEL